MGFRLMRALEFKIRTFTFPIALFYRYAGYFRNHFSVCVDLPFLRFPQLLLKSHFQVSVNLTLFRPFS